MKGYVACKGDVWYAVIYEGVDPITGKERRRWHRAGTDRAEAEALAARLAVAENARRNGHRSELTVGGFIARYWLPAKRLDLEASTFDGYQRVVRLHLLPHIGDIALRGLRTERLEQLYADLLDHGNNRTGQGLAPKTVIDLDTATLHVLAQWRRRQADELGVSDDTMPLHTKQDGNLIHPHTLSQAFERAVATTTLPRISLHDLRHTHATLLLKAGVPLKVVSERLGHSSPAFTMATYQHVLPGMQADAADTFAALLQDNGSAAITDASTGFYPEETR